jgi:DNA polymerase-4
MMPLAVLQQHFGKSAAWYFGIANGEDDRPVVADRPRKSSGAETTFERDLTAPAEIAIGIKAMADEVWAWCEKANLELVRTLLPTAMGVRLLGVTVSNFDQAPADAADALPLFEIDKATVPRPHAAAQVAATGTPCPACRQRRPAAARRPRAPMAGRAHDPAGRGDH